MEVKKDTVVKFHYTLKDRETGEVIDSSAFHGGEPLSVLIGAQNIIPGLEKEMEGMKVGETKTIEVAYKDAYGPRDESLVQKMPRDAFQGIELQRGMPLTARTPDGREIPFIVVDFNDVEVIVDMNHPLAGRDLVFDVEIVEVRDASKEELEHGHAH